MDDMDYPEDRKRYRRRNLLEFISGNFGAALLAITGHAQARKAYRAAMKVARAQEERRRQARDHE
jgi:hypothetical protein